jgi:hypothetical protein
MNLPPSQQEAAQKLKDITWEGYHILVGLEVQLHDLADQMDYTCWSNLARIHRKLRTLWFLCVGIGAALCQPDDRNQRMKKLCDGGLWLPYSILDDIRGLIHRFAEGGNTEPDSDDVVRLCVDELDFSIEGMVGFGFQIHA